MNDQNSMSASALSEIAGLRAKAAKKRGEAEAVGAQADRMQTIAGTKLLCGWTAAEAIARRTADETAEIERLAAAESLQAAYEHSCDVDGAHARRVAADDDYVVGLRALRLEKLRRADQADRRADELAAQI